MPWLTGDTPDPDEGWCRLTRVPGSLGFLQAVGGALAELTNPKNWEQFGTMTPDESAEMATELFYEWTRSDACMIGTIMAYVTVTPPPSCLPCNGSVYERAAYPVLYERLAAAYIVDADHFRTPDLRDKVVLGASVDHPLASTGGAFEHTLTVQEMPAHAHGTDPHAHTTQPHGHATDPHAHTTQPHGHSTLPHSHTDGGHVHGEIPAIPSVAGIGLDAPIPSAVPGAGLTAPASANILPADVTVVDSVVAVDDVTVVVQDASVVVDETTVVVLEAGGGEAFPTMPPYEALLYCIVAK